jgi:hypothetical protein
VEITSNSFVRNLGILLNQAKECQRVHALEGAKHRKAKTELAEWHFTGFDESTAVMDWVAEARQLMSRCPVPREEQIDGNGEKSADGETNGNGEKAMNGEFNGRELIEERVK